MSTTEVLDRIEQRITLLQDVESIESLKARYWRALDRKRPDDVENCLIPEATIDFEGLPRYASREAFMGLVRDAAANPSAFNMHHGQNPHITITGPDAAEGTWEIFFYGIDTSARALTQMAGAYSDTYVRRHNRWWIATTSMRITSLHVQTTEPGLRSVVFGAGA